MNSVCNSILAAPQRAEYNAARRQFAAKQRRHATRRRNLRDARAAGCSSTHTVSHQRRGRCGVSLLSALLRVLCTDTPTQSDSARAWRECARTGVASRHNNVWIFCLHRMSCLIRYLVIVCDTSVRKIWNRFGSKIWYQK